MNLSIIDWSIIVVFFVFITAVATYVRKYTKNVAGFLAADRCAGRYMLSVSEGMSSLGAISIISLFQVYYQAGFTALWWSNINVPVGTVIALSGWVLYRFRRTRAMTLSEFLEKRYSRNFRIFMGIIIFLSGILNFGIFPGVGARFFMTFCGFPEIFFLGSLQVSTYPVVMAVLIIISLYFTFMGGQIAVMLTDFIQGMFTFIVFIVIIAFILLKLGWAPFDDVMNQPESIHFVHPFKGDKIKDFNVWYYVMVAILAFYGTRAWQGSQGYNASALTPHEAKMGAILGNLRSYALMLATSMLAITAIIVLKHPDFTGWSSTVNNVLSGIEDEQRRNQMTVPVVMNVILTRGLLGCFAAVFLAAFISTHDTYLHSWGSIFIQDVVMPFRNEPFDQKTHMLLLRLATVGVAVFIFLFSLVWKSTEAILLWFQITGAVYLSGAGAVIIGGLYTKRGTTIAGYTSMIVGSLLAITGIVIRQFNPDFFLNGMEISFYAAAVACTVYFVVSFITPRQVNLDKILHRGQYAVKDDEVIGEFHKKSIWNKLGLTNEFSRKDRFIFFLVLGLQFAFFTIFIIGTVLNIIFEIPASMWLTYWKIYISFIFIFVIGIVSWLTIGGVRDIVILIKRLKAVPEKLPEDDGWVNKNE